jgi:hypothetical protein
MATPQYPMGGLAERIMLNRTVLNLAHESSLPPALAPLCGPVASEARAETVYVVGNHTTLAVERPQRK